MRCSSVRTARITGPSRWVRDAESPRNELIGKSEVGDQPVIQSRLTTAVPILFIAAIAPIAFSILFGYLDEGEQKTDPSLRLSLQVGFIVSLLISFLPVALPSFSKQHWTLKVRDTLLLAALWAVVQFVAMITLGVIFIMVNGLAGIQ